MKRSTSRSLAAILMVVSLTAGAHGAEAPVGWASVEGGTRGGEGGATVTVSDAAALVAQAQSKPPLIIKVKGTIRPTAAVRVNSNKTIIGVGADAAIIGGGFHVTKVSNVIIRNLSISGATDAVNIEDGSHHVWVDHCDLSRCTDGLLDIKRGSDLVTVSWNHFHDHHKTCLLGHSDKPDIREVDKGHLRVTYHHNFFDGTQTRHPRVRYAEPVHVYNNHFRDNEYGVAALMDSGVLVERNFFENVLHPTLTEYGDSPDPGRLVERDNLYTNSGKPKARGTVAEPRDAYHYHLDRADDVATIIQVGVGVGKIGH